MRSPFPFTAHVCCRYILLTDADGVVHPLQLHPVKVVAGVLVPPTQSVLKVTRELWAGRPTHRGMREGTADWTDWTDWADWTGWLEGHWSSWSLTCGRVRAVVGVAVQEANLPHFNLCTGTKFDGASFIHQLGQQEQRQRQRRER